MNKYIRDKLSLKINLCVSGGKKSKGVVSDKVIDKILKGFDGYGIYEIIWDKDKILPIQILKLEDNIECVYHKTNGVYALKHFGHDLNNNKKCIEITFLNPREHIEFSVGEFRNIKLKQILK